MVTPQAGDALMSLQRIAAVGLVGFIGLAGTLGLVTVGAVGSTAQTRAPSCVSSGSVSGLTASQAQNARTVVAVATQRGGERAAFIAVMVALAESGLRVLTNPNDPSGAAYPNEGVGYDHDSLGLFQQRPSWGTAAQRMSPTESTHLFLDALLRVPGWQEMTPWYAAQMVQRSAFTGRPTVGNHGSSMVGENYWRQADRAVGIVAAIKGSTITLDCGDAGVPIVQTASAGTHGLPAEYAIPQGTSPAGRLAVTFALAQLGKPYVWGGNGPGGYDCSGLTQQAWIRGGVRIGRVVSQQLRAGAPTTLASLQPGDLVMIPGALGTMAAPGHVGMYIGQGLVVHAPRTGDVVRVVSLKPFISDGLAGLRHIS
ncbi:C40 family peptidase [Humibacillus xanthopallidus]|uniref:NlpC/P60 family protein n=1 Tax=Humibacillus xanthopallidus TaxID=412689 RepID=A0A543HTP2_9MICO|nr:C40 family peptidase [Humibacillus xanthopallidus]TQM61733.1 NlpC/P60 family protein [Humibacillus xanthopallidus]